MTVNDVVLPQMSEAKSFLVSAYTTTGTLTEGLPPFVAGKELALHLEVATGRLTVTCPGTTESKVYQTVAERAAFVAKLTPGEIMMAIVARDDLQEAAMISPPADQIRTVLSAEKVPNHLGVRPV